VDCPIQYRPGPGDQHTWQLPASKSAPPFVGWAVNGWELGGILKVNDGPPFTPTFGTGGDPQGLNNGDDWAFQTV